MSRPRSAAAAAAFPAWSKTGPGERRALLMKAADVLASKVGEFTRLMIEETGATGALGRLQRDARRQHAARGGGDDHADLRRGHPVRQAGLAGDGHPPAGRRLRRHRAVERAGHPRHARGRDAARLRQHRGAEGLRDVPRHAPPDRPGDRRGGPAEGRDQRHHQRSQGRGRGRRGAGRRIRRSADQLHRLDQGRPDHRRAGRPASEAGAARARRQGAAGRARRRRHRRRGQRRGVRRLHEPGPDLHVDRADHRRREDRRRVRRQARGARLEAAGRRPARPCRAGLADQQRSRPRRWTG